MQTEVWLSKGKRTSPSLQSSQTNPLAWQRWGRSTEGPKAALRGPHQPPQHDAGSTEAVLWVCPMAHLAVQLDVLGEEGVYLGEGAAQAPRLDVDQVLQRVHLVVLHKVLPVLQLQAESLSLLCLSPLCPSLLHQVPDTPHSCRVPPAQSRPLGLTCSSSRASIASLQVMK